MTKFHAIAKNGGFDMGSEFNRQRLKEWMRNNEGMRLSIEPVTPESKNLRNFFEGAVLPLVTYYQEGLSYRDAGDREKVREWLKDEFNGGMVVVAGKSKKVTLSTKGRKVLRQFVDRVIDWMGENGYQIELLNPDEYKVWKDTIFPYGGAEDYITHLKDVGKLR